MTKRRARRSPSKRPARQSLRKRPNLPQWRRPSKRRLGKPPRRSSSFPCPKPFRRTCPSRRPRPWKPSRATLRARKSSSLRPILPRPRRAAGGSARARPSGAETHKSPRHARRKRRRDALCLVVRFLAEKIVGGNDPFPFKSTLPPSENMKSSARRTFTASDT